MPFLERRKALPLATSQAMAERSRLAVTTVLPSGEKAARPARNRDAPSARGPRARELLRILKCSTAWQSGRKRPKQESIVARHEQDRRNAARMAAELFDHLVAGNIPDANVVVIPAGNQQPSVTGKSHAAYAGRVLFESHERRFLASVLETA